MCNLLCMCSHFKIYWGTGLNSTEHKRGICDQNTPYYIILHDLVLWISQNRGKYIRIIYILRFWIYEFQCKTCIFVILGLSNKTFLCGCYIFLTFSSNRLKLDARQLFVAKSAINPMPLKEERDLTRKHIPKLPQMFSPVSSCKLGRGSDKTPRHCSSTGKGITMRPSASWGKSLIKLLSLRKEKKERKKL